MQLSIPAYNHDYEGAPGRPSRKARLLGPEEGGGKKGRGRNKNKRGEGTKRREGMKNGGGGMEEGEKEEGGMELEGGVMVVRGSARGVPKCE